jgi:hypothetical protein
MSTLNLTEDFEKGTLKIALAELPEKMLDAAYEELDQQAELMKGIWQVIAPVDTGSYRDSIRKERGGTGKHWRIVRVRAGGYIVNPKTRRLVDYAVILERKYHCGERAWREVCGEILDLINRRVVAEVKP